MIDTQHLHISSRLKTSYVCFMVMKKVAIHKCLKFIVNLIIGY